MSDKLPIYIYDSIDSTMLEANRLLSNNLYPPFVVQALKQSDGYGRMQRAWQSPEGNLYMTIALKPLLPSKMWHQASVVVAVSMFEAIGDYIGDRHLSLKWPNDLILDGKKLAGILIEADHNRGLLLVGIGVNIAAAPIESSNSIGSIDLETVRDAIINKLLLYVSRWNSGNIEEICKLWVTNGPSMGSKIKVMINGAYSIGEFCGINADGALLLKIDDIISTHYSAEVIGSVS
jgi:BirA family biotin operon repressor/biotin-[acetyl-CoA-carboxylase] ligase